MEGGVVTIDRQGVKGSAPPCASMRRVCVSKCASQLKEVSTKARHTYNTHTHLCCPISLMCYSPYLCPCGWPSLGLDNQAWAPPRAKEASAPPKPACCVHGPSLAPRGSNGLRPTYPWWPDPSKRLAPGPCSQLAPKAEACAHRPEGALAGVTVSMTSKTKLPQHMCVGRA